MKHVFKHLGTYRWLYAIAIVAIIGFTGCSTDSGGPGDGPGGGGGGGGGGGDPTPTAKYIITGSGTTFTATKGGATVGTANSAIQTVIDSIQTDANGANIEIQFGTGSVLDIGSASIAFNPTGGTWGIITLSGKVTSASTQYTISSYVSIISTADITNTSPDDSSIYRYAVSNHSSGTFTINGGTVSAIHRAVRNSNGTIIINGGTVFSTGSGVSTINSESEGTGTIIVNGGRIESRGKEGTAIWGFATTTITGGTIEVTRNDGQVVISNRGTLTVSNGTIKTASIYYSAIENSGGTATITGGTIQAATTNAIYNSGATLTISGGTIQSSGTKVIPVNGSTIWNGTKNDGSGGILTINGGTVKNTSTGYAVYNGLANGNYKGTVTIGAGATITGDMYGVN